MPESEFDKQVQRELEGLRIRPSATVWENVEKELRQKKRRRVIIAFWLVAGIALLGSTTYFLTRKEDRTLAGNAVSAGKTGTDPHGTTPATTTGVQTGNPKQTETVPTKQEQAQGQGDNPGTDNNNNDLTAKDKAAPVQNGHNNATLSATDNSEVHTKPGQPAGKQKHTGQSSTAAKDQKASSGNKKTSPGSIDPAIVKGKTKRPGRIPADINGATGSADNTKTDTSATAAPPITAQSNETQHDIVAVTPTIIDSITAKADSALSVSKEEPSAAEVPAKSPGKKAAKKLKWSLDLAIGGSGPVSRPFLVGNNHADMAYDNVQYTPVQGGGLWQPVTPPVNAFGPVYSPRSDINPGLSYRAGVLVEFPLSERVGFSSGLQYQYQSNNIRIGSYVNTRLTFNNFASQQVQANGVYQGVQTKTFTNRYHYAQIPLLFNFQLNKSKKMPVILNTGFSAGYLVSTNALTYDTLQGGTYYHDKNAFKRFQFSFTTGVSFRFGNNRAMQWSIGPEASMGLRKMVKTEYDTRQYPLYIGLQGRIYLPKKKR
ncbi:outer membrane beta-barrel protein [Terrimonas sp. NA20]|uniref:Outer membrane beta-barrel protein n=1 Tax=Terrimonas ginsenosidimutans TaxID=2908004 RepID=A0ABS9L0T0_9BACT|nr:porin family protein [Terrimonas ginsenosidimutans]MCG2618216.1 outer membrane beta-barrel protein [Terrimonas ginsenosidimutans]